MQRNSFFTSALGRFRLIALAEGTSFLVLLFIAMPFKYLAKINEPVLYVGWAHGILFILYALFLLKVWSQCRWPFRMAAIAMIAALLPFGTFVLDRKLKKGPF